MNVFPLVVPSCGGRLINTTAPHRLALARGSRLLASGKYNPRQLTCFNDYTGQTTWRSSSNVPRTQQVAATQTMSPAAPTPKSKPAIPRPSSSVILVSPRNEVLLLHRVKTSTSFASAHVFPGGNLSAQDGPCPPAEDLKRHDDGRWYRNAAIRELFEESGILLAKDKISGRMLALPEEQREQGRRAIHQNQITFAEWLEQQNANAAPDTEHLIPFTRWITPANNTRRYTTQMYLYFLPLPADATDPVLGEIPPEGQREEIQVPTSDGGVEVTEARFLPASGWLRMAQSGEVMLFPPQFLLLHLVAGFLDKDPGVVNSLHELQRRRDELTEFVATGQPPWSEKCISPKMLKMSSDGRAVLALDQPGPELRGTDRQGEPDRVVLVKFERGSARDLEVRWKKDAFEEKSSL